MCRWRDCKRARANSNCYRISATTTISTGDEWTLIRRVVHANGCAASIAGNKPPVAIVKPPPGAPMPPPAAGINNDGVVIDKSKPCGYISVTCELLPLTVKAIVALFTSEIVALLFKFTRWRIYRPVVAGIVVGNGHVLINGN